MIHPSTLQSCGRNLRQKLSGTGWSMILTLPRPLNPQSKPSLLFDIVLKFQTLQEIYTSTLYQTVQRKYLKQHSAAGGVAFTFGTENLFDWRQSPRQTFDAVSIELSHGSIVIFGVVSVHRISQITLRILSILWNCAVV